MASYDRLTAMADRQAQQRQTITLTLIRALLGLWRGFGRVDDSTAVLGMAAKSATLTLAATDRERLLQRSYLTAAFREMGISTRQIPQMQPAYPRPADPLDVWQRPVGKWIWARRQGAAPADEQTTIASYLTALAATDVGLADRDTAHSIYQSRDAEISGYRRVIHPELSRSGTCGLCIAASSRTYHSSDLMPLHGGSCHCTTLPIRGADDPGFRLNETDLKQIYAAAGSSGAADLQNVRITIDEHGELGPVLIKQGDHFRTAREAGRPPYVPPTPENTARQLERNLASATSGLQSAQSTYTDFLAAHPDALDPDSPFASERLGLFRAVKYLTEYQAALTSRSQRLGL